MTVINFHHAPRAPFAWDGAGAFRRRHDGQVRQVG